MKKSLFVITSVVILLALISCNQSSGPSGPAPTPTMTPTATGVYINGVVKNREDKTNITKPYIELRYGDSGGAYIT